MIAMFNGQPVIGSAGKDATINGVNTLEIKAGENVTLNQEGNNLTVSASGDSGDVYSTEETRIGTWIDGKPIYSRVFTARGPSSNTTFLVIGNISNIEKVVYLGGTLVFDDSVNTFRPVPYALFYNGVYSIMSPNVNKKNGNVELFTETQGTSILNTTVTLIVKYTKTTDPTPTAQTTLLTSQVELPQSVTLSSQEIGFGSSATATLPSTITEVSVSASSAKFKM